MLSVIEQSRYTLLLEFYMVSSGSVANSFIGALIRAAERGVQVCWLIDDFGSRRLNEADVQRLIGSGVELQRFNPLKLLKFERNFARDHRKVLIADQSIGFIGGTGISDEYLHRDPLKKDTQDRQAWHEVMFRVEGAVLDDMVEMFRRQWLRSGGSALNVAATIRDGKGLGNWVAGNAMARLAVSDGAQIKDIKQSFVRHISNAGDRVWLATAYFLPSFSVRRSLRKAALRGVDVRLIVAGPCTDHPWVYHASKRYYRRLLKSGVRIYEYQPSFLHTKLGLCDQWLSAGSCNLDHWNLRWNLEANIEVVEPELVSQVEQLLSHDMQQSEEILYRKWSARPWRIKLKELLWSLVCQLLLKIR
ncbi:cardiolipin synthase B [Amphritea balenae]|uniref:Cardiolipin synthase B n=2 Tax=Amphritea balenae TaxID=452629 RepID=A0A3P1SK26_9GAMM|nr:cardiolipin synthase B [Amphritea balenae]GGK74651.1 cardiolipin synthase B [Amphritea balenae]